MMPIGRIANFQRQCFIIPLSCALLFFAGCSEPRGPASVKSDDLTLKVPAIKQDVQARNTTNVPQMVKDLCDDDSAVRFYAIQGLHRLTGQDFGYHYYDDANDRKPAIDRWQAWLKQRGGK